MVLKSYGSVLSGLYTITPLESSGRAEHVIAVCKEDISYRVYM